MLRRASRLCSLAALALATAVAGPAAAQRTAPGWIGISYEIRPGTGGAPLVVVTGVQPESPAGRAGVEPGDRILAIGELSGASELAELSARLHLTEGELVRVLLERDGRERELRLRAAERPRFLPAARVEAFETAEAMVARTDSVVEAMFRAMDSLRFRLQEAAGAPPSSAVRVRIAPDAEAASRVWGVSAPFEFFVFRGEQHDSLRREMERLEEEFERLHGLEVARLTELGSRAQAARDAQLVSVRAALEELGRRSASLRAAMAEAARVTAGREYLAATDGSWPQAFRPLTPYLVGSNRVAGAQVVELRPELAGYFAVERGVLVVDVAPGTPAAIAGLRPGDVVTRLDQVAVQTVEDLRFGVAQAPDTLPVTLVRHGATVEVLLRRR
ncbi:MAG TPA: PDZ domain-containing protein [Longimicrobiales bacterium]|nr:PDZ domain-containing protein [Longimicrobiales bacterium]